MNPGHRPHQLTKTVLIPLPTQGFDPTEVAVPWQILTRSSIQVIFSSPTGQSAEADPIMATGKGLGLLKSSLMADYYRTYPETVEAVVTAALSLPSHFVRGPISLKRDSATHLDRGFVVRDRNYLSARWPGDAHCFAHEYLKLIRKRGTIRD